MVGKLKIIFEDKRILVIDKLAGLVVNRSATVGEATLQDQLSEYFKLGNNLGIGDRAGIVHRLDRETSGVLVVAKTQRAFEILQSQFKDRSVKKEYTTLVHGHVGKESGSIAGAIGRIGKLVGLVGLLLLHYFHHFLNHFVTVSFSYGVSDAGLHMVFEYHVVHFP